LSSDVFNLIFYSLCQEGVISFKDLFNAPSFDELEEVARDHKGDVKKLSNKQLEDVRLTGYGVPCIAH
jgi:hypothetical protein